MSGLVNLIPKMPNNCKSVKFWIDSNYGVDKFVAYQFAFYSYINLNDYLLYKVMQLKEFIKSIFNIDFLSTCWAKKNQEKFLHKILKLQLNLIYMCFLTIERLRSSYSSYIQFLRFYLETIIENVFVCLLTKSYFIRLLYALCNSIIFRKVSKRNQKFYRNILKNN